MRLGRLAEALADFEEVIELTHGTKDEYLFRVFRALTKARLGDLSALALLGDQVGDLLKVGEGARGVSAASTFYCMLSYDAACVHAALAQRTLQDQGKPHAERQRLAGQDLQARRGALGQGAVGGGLQGVDPSRGGSEGTASRPFTLGSPVPAPYDGPDVPR